MIPVILPGVGPFDPSELHPFLATRTWVDFRADVGDQRALQNLIQAIRGIPFGSEPADGGSDSEVCPFRGLSPFEEAQAEYFFGRENELQRLVEQLRTTRLVAVVGPSGSGKSSLVRAGLVSRIRANGLPGSDRWKILVIRPGGEPVTALAAAMTSLAPHDGMQATVDRLATDSRSLHLGAAFGMRDEPADAHLLLVVDQLEEIFTLCRSEQQRSALLANICYATSIPAGRVVIVLTLRADFYPMLARYPEFRQLVQNRQLLLGMPDAEGVRQAIEGPAWHVGLEIEPGLVETIVADVGSEPGMLPLLQQALLETWRRRSGRLLALAGYQDAGGVRRALADRAEEIYQGLDPAEQDSARQLFLRLVQPGTATEDTRRRVSLRELGDSSPPQQSVSEHVIPRFVRERLLTADADVAGGERWIEVSHEALIRGWPRLKSWIDSDRSGLRLHRGLTTAAQEWDDRDHDESMLFRGRRLADTLEWTHETQRWLNRVERDFLQASTALDERLKHERRRRQRWTVTALLVALVVISSVAVAAIVQGREATRQRDLATSGELAVRSDVERAIDPMLAVSLALQSIDASHTEQSELALRQSTLQARQLRTLLGHQGRVLSATFSPDGQLLASGGDGGVVRLWGAQDGRLVKDIETRQGTVYAVRFSPDGRLLATGGHDGSVMLVDTGTGSARVLLPAATNVYPTGVGFVSGGAVLVAGFSDGSLRSARLDGGRENQRADPTAVYAVATSRDGRSIATAGDDGTAKIWTVGPMAVRLVLGDKQSRVVSVAFNPRGDELATAGEDGTVRRWATADGRLLSTWPVDRQAIYSISYSPDGHLLAMASEDGSISVWSTVGVRAVTMLGHRGGVFETAFSPQTRTIVSAGRDGTVRTWDPGDVEIATSSVTRGSFSPDGTKVVTGGTDGAVRVWKVGAAAPDIVLTGHQGSSWARFFPDGRHVVSAGDDGTVRVWAVDKTESPRIFTPHAGKVWVASASPNGGAVVSGGDDGRVVLTKIVDGRSTVIGEGLGPIYETGYSVDGTELLAAGEGGDLYVWDMTTPANAPRVFAGKAGPVYSARFSADGNRVVTGGVDGNVRIWNLRPPDPSGPLVLGGHQGAVESTDFGPDGARVASAGIDGTIRVWDAATGWPLATVAHHEGQASSVSFGPDGKRLLSVGTEDRTVRLYMCEVCGPLDEVLALARSRAAAN